MAQKIKTLQIIHLAICAGMVFIYVMLGNISIDKLRINAVTSSDIIHLIVPTLALLLSYLLFKSQLKKIDPKLTTEQQLPYYQTASIIRWAILEMASFYILLQKPDFIVIGLFIIAYLIYLRPSEDRLKKDINGV